MAAVEATGVTVTELDPVDGYGNNKMYTAICAWDDMSDEGVFFEIRYTTNGGKTWKDGYWRAYGGHQKDLEDASYRVSVSTSRVPEIGFRIRQKGVIEEIEDPDTEEVTKVYAEWSDPYFAGEAPSLHSFGEVEVPADVEFNQTGINDGVRGSFASYEHVIDMDADVSPMQKKTMSFSREDNPALVLTYELTSVDGSTATYTLIREEGVEYPEGLADTIVDTEWELTVARPWKLVKTAAVDAPLNGPALYLSLVGEVNLFGDDSHWSLSGPIEGNEDAIEALQDLRNDHRYSGQPLNPESNDVVVVQEDGSAINIARADIFHVRGETSTVASPVPVSDDNPDGWERKVVTNTEFLVTGSCRPAPAA